MGPAISTAIISGLNIILALIQAQQEVAAGTRDLTQEELAMVDLLNSKSEVAWDALVSATKARMAEK